jgi:hypothetical protein
MAKKDCSQTLSFFSEETDQFEIAVKDWERLPGVRVFAADYGASGGKFCIVRDDRIDEPRFITKDDLMKLNGFNQGDFLILEDAHLQPRNERVSTAQVMTFEELLEFQNNADKKKVNIRCFPQTLTPKYRTRFFGEDSKNDVNDAITVLRASLERNPTSLKKFKPTKQKEFSEIQEWAHEQIKDMNDIANKFRIEHNFEDPMCLVAFQKCKILISQIAFSKPNSVEKQDAIRWILGENIVGDQKTSIAVSLWIALFDWNGNKRIFNGKCLSLKNNLRYLCGFKPHHFKGGVVRSNLMHWGMKKIMKDIGLPSYISPDKNDPINQKFIELKRRYRKSILFTMEVMIEAFDKKMGRC